MFELIYINDNSFCKILDYQMTSVTVIDEWAVVIEEELHVLNEFALLRLTLLHEA